MIDISKYEKIKEATENFYKKYNKLYSPFFDDQIYFTSEGFNHLVYKNARTERNRSVQIMKFQLFPKAIKVIELSSTVQEYDEMLTMVEKKMKKKKIKESKIVKYWGFVAIINKQRIKVIIRQIGENGKLHFWSVMPAWNSGQYRTIKLTYNSKGNLLED